MLRKVLEEGNELFANTKAGAKLYAFANVVLASLVVIENKARPNINRSILLCLCAFYIHAEDVSGFILTSYKKSGKEEIASKSQQIKIILATCTASYATGFMSLA